MCAVLVGTIEGAYAQEPSVVSVSLPANGAYVAGQNLDFTVNYDENVTVNTAGGTPRLSLTIGASTRYATYISGSGIGALTFRYTVQNGDIDSDGIALDATLQTNGGTLQDAVGNNADTNLGAIGSLASVLVDAQGPSVDSVTLPGNGTYTAGQNLDFTVQYDENTTVNTGGGTPRLSLTVGTVTRYANYLSGSGTSGLTFRYTVQSGDSDSGGIALNATLQTNGGTLRDAIGNSARTNLGAIGSLASVLVDAAAPAVTGVEVPASASYPSGANLDFTVNLDEPVTVSGGTPRIAMTIGAGTRYAAYVSGSGASALTFRYTVQAGDNDNDGVALAAVIDANGGNLSDGAGNDLMLTLNLVGATGGVLVDTTAPSLNSTAPADEATAVAFDTDLVLTFSEAVLAGSAGANTNVFDDEDVLVESVAANSTAVDISDSTATIELAQNLTPARSYYVMIDSGAFVDAASNAYVGISDTISLNFTVVNTSPVAADDAAAVNEDQAVQISVLDNDSDPDSSLNAASVQVTSGAASGGISVNTGTGVLTYIPTANFNGTDTFTYTVKDSFGALSNMATVTLTVNAVNDPPVAMTEVVATPQNNALSIDVADNDTDLDAGDSVDAASIVVVTVPGEGTASLNGAQVLYTPNPGFSGSDSFVYTIEDRNGAASNQATVIVNVTGANDLPSAADDGATVDEDGAVILDLLANDSDLDGSIDATTVTVVSPASHGTTTVDAVTGAVTYTPAVNFNGSDTFSYVVQDDAGGTSNLATAVLTVNSVNDDPVANADMVALEEEVAHEVNVLGNDSDLDGVLNTASVEIVTGALDGTTSVNAATGTVTYTPGAGFGGNDSFTYRVMDNQGAWSSPATVTLTTQPVNNPPLANSDSVTTDEDMAVMMGLLANDDDADGLLNPASVVLVSNPANGGVINHGDGSVTYTPAADYHGADSFTYTVSDDTGDTSDVATVTVTVSTVNDLPVISGAAPVSATVGQFYSFTPVASDPDADDELSFSAVGLPGWLSLHTSTGVLSGIPAGPDVGSHTGIQISVTDGIDTTSMAAFGIEVVPDVDSDGDSVSDYQESLDGTDPTDPADYLDSTAPVLTAPAEQTLDAVAFFTPIMRKQLLGLDGTTTDAEVQDALAELVTDNIDGDGCCDPVVKNMTGDVIHLRSGRNEITWSAVDRMGNTAESTQVVNLRPLVSLSRNQTTVEGASVTFRILLNGESPSYPLTVPFVIDATSTADNGDHDLVGGTVTLTETNGVGQTQASVSVEITTDAFSEGDETLLVRLDDRTSNAEDLADGHDPANANIFDINSGARTDSIIRIVEGNLAPEANLQLSQDGALTRLVTAMGGPVTVSLAVVDPNLNETQSFDWSATDSALVDTDGDLANGTLIFGPNGLNVGRHQIQVQITDSQGATGTARLFFRVVDALPTLNPAADSDADGIDDQSEGTADSDDDGIPDYVDNLSASNVLPEEAGESGSYLVECEPGTLCSLGRFALMGELGGARLRAEDLNTQAGLSPDIGFEPVGGIFDYEIHGLPDPGQSVRVVIPLRQAIPEDAIYRKFQNGAWKRFVEDDRNALHSAFGYLGYCPAPGSQVWEAGLVTGHLCIQITIEDGGPNDADGLANTVVEDPGAVSVPTEESVPPTVTPWGGGGAVGVFWWILSGAAWLTSRRVARDRASLLLSRLGLKLARHEMKTIAWSKTCL